MRKKPPLQLDLDIAVAAAVEQPPSLELVELGPELVLPPVDSRKLELQQHLDSPVGEDGEILKHQQPEQVVGRRGALWEAQLQPAVEHTSAVRSVAAGQLAAAVVVGVESQAPPVDELHPAPLVAQREVAEFAAAVGSWALLAAALARLVAAPVRLAAALARLVESVQRAALVQLVAPVLPLVVVRLEQHVEQVSVVVRLEDIRLVVVERLAA